jgi:mRNA interferase RelE/StbE
MAYSVVFSPIADKDLDNLSPPHIKRLLRKILGILEDPRAHAKPLKGISPPVYSLRIGDYRVIFELDDETVKMTVLLIRHRSKVYRDFSSDTPEGNPAASIAARIPGVPRALPPQ